MSQTKENKVYFTELCEKRWLSAKTFELVLSRPPSFEFRAGQRIRFIRHNLERDYSLVTAPDQPTLGLCVRLIEGGAFSPLLHNAAAGSRFDFTGPHGYFYFQPSQRPAIFVATGTGIAPFCAMARAGVTGFTLLHGVSSPNDLYYKELFLATAKLYIPCLPDITNAPANSYEGRVTGYLEKHLPHGSYDFYLCGRRDMIRDVILLVDDHFRGSLVYTEIFY
ncbi:MAG: FAD-binding oxidoreductase [Desulfobacterales bacterium]|jgi:NAD(P)H-flavin reductase